MQYYIRNQRNELVEAVEVEPFTVEGFEDWLLFTHRSLNDNGDGLFEPPYYGASEATTGLAFGTHAYKFSIFAKEEASQRLQACGREKAQRILVRALSKYGLINA